MKATLALLGGLLVMTGTASAAGVDAIAKQHARDLATQNNNRYGPAPGTPAPPQAAAPGAPAPAAPQLAPSLVKFQSDLATLQSGTPATTEQQQKFSDNVVAGAQGNKPTPASTAKFIKDLSDAYADKPLSAANRARLVQYLDAVLNPGKYPMAKIDGIITAVQTMFRDNGLSQARADILSADVKKLSDEVQGIK
jgi:hypothetical protein